METYSTRGIHSTLGGDTAHGGLTQNLRGHTTHRVNHSTRGHTHHTRGHTAQGGNTQHKGETQHY